MQTIIIGMDLDLLNIGHEINVNAVAELALTGKLTIRINEGQTITSSQLDALQVSWEKVDDGSNLYSSVRSSNSLKRRDWDDEMEYTEISSKPEILDKIRLSLNEYLSDVSDKEGLTDEELNQKVAINNLF
jgi:hypothetical protein